MSGRALKSYSGGANRSNGRGGHGGEYTMRERLQEALDPTRAPSKPKTFAEMTDAEKAEMRRLYEGKKP